MLENRMVIDEEWKNLEKEETVYCEECGKELTYEDKYYDDTYDNLCIDCLLCLHERIT